MGKRMKQINTGLHIVAMEEFLAGFAYGATTVVVGQPLDTIKTRMQAIEHMSKMNMRTTAAELWKAEVLLIQLRRTNTKRGAHILFTSMQGIKGFYRGGTPLLLGGGLMRSAQFGVYVRAPRCVCCVCMLRCL